MARNPPRSPKPIKLDQYGPADRSAWMEIDWSEHQRWVEIDGRQVNVVEMGSGDHDPIVFIHGLAGSWQNWLENLPRFADSRRIIAMDLPGFGFSEMPEEKISIPGYGRFVAKLLGELGIARADIVGNSMGGFIGLELALQFPELVDRLVLVSAAGLTAEKQRNEPALAAMRRAENVLAFYSGWFAARSEVLSRRPRMRRLMMGVVTAHPERLPAPLIAEQVRGSGKPGFIDALDALTDYPIRERLGEIESPVLVVWGTKDRLVPVKDAYRFKELIGDNARVVVYDDTGHLPQLERPADFNDELERFFDLETRFTRDERAGESDDEQPAAAAG